MARPDPHSYSDSNQPQTRSISFSLEVDFAARTLSGETVLRFHAPGAGPLDLDTRRLAVHAVTSLDGAPLPHALADADPILGARLRIELPAGSAGVRLRTTTSPEASALQWLGPEQTAGGAHPFLFSQCQPIHARSLLPLQDSPAVRVTLDDARLTVPAGLTALLAAAAVGREPAGPGKETFRFTMPQAIPPYLLAFAVGDLASRELSPRCAVWAERPVVDAAAAEFSGVERMIAAAESLFGPYEWDRFDILVMPPSFPYGGMENPRLTFVTPSLLAGDKSLVNVIAHELAHAWTGNLVTNASANDFWLNEGFTVYAERRILEALEGREASELHAALGRTELERALARFAGRPQLTRLRNDLAGLDPDEAYSTVPYEKGYLLLRKLEETAGRPAWDRFLRTYLDTFRFQSIDTAQLLALLERELPGLAARAGALAFVDQPMLPPDAPRPRPARLEELQALAATGEPPSAQAAAAMTPTELLIYLHALPEALPPDSVRRLDALFGMQGRSLELRTPFALLQLRAGIPEGLASARRVAQETGRMKYLRPIFLELAKGPAGVAEALFAETKAGYHPIARGVVEGLLRSAPATKRD